MKANTYILFTCFFLLLNTSKIFSQIKIGRESPEYDRVFQMAYSGNFDEVVGTDSKALYVEHWEQVGRMNETFKRVFRKYSRSDYSLVWSKEVAAEIIPAYDSHMNYRYATHQHSLQRRFVAHGKLFLIQSLDDKNSFNRSVVVSTLDPDGNVSPTVELLKLEMKSIRGPNPSTFTFACTLSPDSNYAVISASLYSSREITPTKSTSIKIAVVDLRTLSTIWKMDLPDEYNDMPTLTNEFKIDNQGNVAFVTCSLPNRKEGAGKMSIGFIGTDKNPHFKELNFPNSLEYGSWKLSIRPDGCYALAGFFLDPAKRKDRKFKNSGVFCAVIGKDKNTLISSSTEYFPEQVLDKLDFKNSGSDKKKIAMSFRSIRLEAMGNDLYLVGYNSTIFEGNYGIQVWDNDIVLTKITSTGKVEWMRTLPNRSIPATPDVCDFDLFTNGKDKLFLLYTCGPKTNNFTPGHYDATDIKAINSPGGNRVPVYVSVSSAGEVKGDFLMGNSEFTMRVPGGWQLGPSKALMIFSTDLKEKFCEFNLE